MDKGFDFSKLPYSWAMCYLSECSRKEECPYFHPIRKVQVAIGFKDIFREVKERDHSAIRRKIANYMGRGGTYYRYRNGERHLTPKQQEWIRQLFPSLRLYRRSGDRPLRNHL